MNENLDREKLQQLLLVYPLSGEDIALATTKIDAFWQQFKPYADNKFMQKLEDDFIARFWEMYLVNVILEKKYSLLSRKELGKKGPDICIENNQNKIWIEATAGGKNAKDIYSNTPDDEVILRYRSLIESKFKKYKEYLKDGIIQSSEPYIIAINAYRIPFAEENCPDYMLPNIVRAVLPFGEFTIIEDRDTGKVINSGYSRRENLYTQRNSPVRTDIFLLKEYEGISGVLFSTTGINDVIREKDNDFIFVHNPMARNPISPRWLEFKKEYRFSLE